MLDFAELYNPHITSINEWRGGPYQQAVSALTNVNNKWYDGKEYQVYAYEYTPGADGEITWFVGKEKTWKVDGRALGPNGNVGQRVIPLEPLSVIMNFGMSPSFAPVNVSGITPLLPATMRFDYVRIYQDPGEKSVTCDPKGWETTKYIKEHEEAYMNPNLTTWYVESVPTFLFGVLLTDRFQGLILNSNGRGMNWSMDARYDIVPMI